MGLRCLFGSHNWHGCKCSRCGQARNDGHDWSIDYVTCAKCGANRSALDIERIDDGHAVEPLIAALMNGVNNVPNNPYQRRHGDWSACRPVTKALGNIGDHRAVESIVSALVKCTNYASAGKSDLLGFDRDMCVEAISALGKIGDRRAVEPLIDNLKKFVAVRATAKALEKIGDARAVEPLIELLRYAEFGPQVVDVLGTFGDARAAGPLVDFLVGHGNVHEWSPASDILVKIGSPAVEPIINALRSSQHIFNGTTYSLVWTLTRIGDARAVPALVSALSHRQYQTRKVAAQELVRLYKSGSLNSRDSDLILSVRNVIIAPYIKRPGKIDEWGYAVPPSEEGIGIAFPL